ncbi:ABC transporter permease [Anaerosalibacter bizertensis]|uniref:ABC transporter permease n=1 Tax=Anaerosalibacter bizertensis TaxID=932217 RepID=A0A9Q4FL89_9FIRM|nr:oligopeptide ABC transporter permease [Anaerosalibacter bizertensis]MBV1818240.1 ABC transporter permease [Bacteroidales bacterium MSK.15.36]MCB5559391.1 ABC transporter permease [Anaerosalibacter bizertensis]MCG4564578.1 ABC transporter permease [Anaerosalibacter bizertensis]MCG4583075.1 ABC transporter permease [Anaerosalibacter bizertensis]MCG4584154.1 ABC transporter permease [Anaerosalibacter bizertensis]
MTEKNLEVEKKPININDSEEEQEILSPWKMFVRKFKKNKIAVAGLIIFIIMILSALLAPILTPYNPYEMDYSKINQPPSSEHLLGTDEVGRDYLTRILYGGRVSMKVGLFAVIIEIIIGALVGGLAGYYGGWVDNLLMRLVEIFMSFPFLPLAITISAVIGTKVEPQQRMYIVMMIIGLLSWPGLARMIRGQILSLREQEFVQAARALGIRDSKIIWRHLIPNTVGYIIVSATLGMAGAIMSESGLSFLGLGVTPPTPTWGNLIQNAREAYILRNRVWLWLPPGVCIFLAVMSINLFGDGLRDAIDPKSK